MKPGLILAALLACLALPAHAHTAWVEAGDGDYPVVFGHHDKLEGYAPAKVKAVAAYDARGTALAATRAEDAERVRLKFAQPPALVTLHFDSGYWTKTAEGSKNLPKHQVPGALSASRVEKFGKSVFAWSAAATTPRGQRLEIVPLAATVPPVGGTLEVQVLWEGKPLAGAKLTRGGYAKEEAFETDAAGKAHIPVVAGTQMIEVGHRVALAGDPAADQYAAAANLRFAAR
jgi:nickel transport protein